MLFSIDADAGAQIVGWVLPDNPNAAPSIRVDIGHTSAVIKAVVYRPLLKEQNLHNTGICGFFISTSEVPELAEARDLKVSDADTDLLLYQRRPYPIIDRKLIIVEPSILPAFGIHQGFSACFQMSYQMVERYNEETIRAILGISFSNSIYVGGRIFPRQFDYLYRDRDFKVAILLRNPFEELAERLLILKLATERDDPSLIDKLGHDLVAAAKNLPSFDPFNEESLVRALKRINGNLRGFLSNPLVRQLSTRYADDLLDPAAVALALDTLADFDVVGMRVDVPDFVEAVYAALEYEGTVDTPVLTTADSVMTLADRLKAMPVAVELARLDYDVFTAVASARKKVMA